MVIVCVEGESEVVKFIFDVIFSVGGGLIEFCKIEVVREIVSIFVKSWNIFYFFGGNNMLLGINLFM